MTKKISIVIFVLFLFSCASQKAVKETKTPQNRKIDISFQPYLNSITQNDLKKHLTIFASDSFSGRGTGQKEQQFAIDYLKSAYKKMDISALENHADYGQKFNVIENNLPIYTTFFNDKKIAKADELFTYFVFPSVKLETKQLVYLNYGIDTKEYSDYKKNNVKDKVVLIRFGEPKDNQGNYLINGNTERSKYSSSLESILHKVEDAKRNGAKAILISTNFSDENLIQWDGKEYNKIYDVFQDIRYKIGRYSRPRLQDSLDIDFPTFFVSSEFLQKLGIDSVNTLQNGVSINTDLEIDYNFGGKVNKTENVLAYIKGKEKPEEVVVISAHLDHEGIKNGKIYNGADDDGSGTVSILEIAEAFKKAEQEGKSPRRSVLFLHVSGEELGLLGSDYYTQNPAFPLSKTIADLNIDMIGRVDRTHKENDNYIYLIGSDRISKDLHSISEEVNTHLGQLKFDYTFNQANDPNRFYYRSDHYNFAKHGTPVIFYFNGTHEDYHQPSDTIEKIRFDLLEKRTQLIFATAWQLANIEGELK